MIYLLLSAICDSIWTVILSKSRGIKDWGITLVGVLMLLSAILLFKKACDTVSLSIAVVVWSGLTIMCTIVYDVFWGGNKIDPVTGFFMLLCIVSILGMNYYAKHGI